MQTTGLFSSSSPQQANVGGGSSLIGTLGAALVLVFGVVLLTGLSLDRTQTAMVRFLAEKGVALVTALESGVRSGTRSRTGIRLQYLVEELADRPDVRFIAVTMPDGTILAHSNPARVGEVLNTRGGRELGAETIAALRPSETPSWAIIDMEGSRAFVVFKTCLLYTSQESLIQADEHRDLHDDGETAASRVDLVGLVQLHHFLVEGFLVVLMLFAELLHHGLELLHLLHGLEALLGQGPEDDADTEGKHQDGDAPVPHKGMEEGQNGQQGAGDDREHAEVHGLRQVIGSRGQHGAVLGAEPPVHGHGHFAAVGRREQIGAFEREAPHVCLLYTSRCV